MRDQSSSDAGVGAVAGVDAGLPLNRLRAGAGGGVLLVKKRHELLEAQVIEAPRALLARGRA